MKKTLATADILIKIGEKSKSEGWEIHYTGIQDEDNNLYEIRRVDEDADWPFETDMEAIRSVAFGAIEFPQSHWAEAVQFLALHSPEEINKMFRYSLDDEDFKEMCEALHLNF
jgi:hypothetical protein